MLINPCFTGIIGRRRSHTIGISIRRQERFIGMNPNIYRVIKRRILFLEYAPGQIRNEQEIGCTYT